MTQRRMAGDGSPVEQDIAWLDEHEQRAWRGFLRMHAVVGAALRRQLQQGSDLSLGDYEILVCLSEAENGELRSFRIAEQLQWEASRLSHQLRRMERRGLVERRDCPTDGRGMTTAITADGVAAIRRAAPLHVAEVRRVFVDRLSPEQLDALIACADAVLGDEHSDPTG